VAPPPAQSTPGAPLASKCRLSDMSTSDYTTDEILQPEWELEMLDADYSTGVEDLFYE